jgi:thioesterase domain-containing protein
VPLHAQGNGWPLFCMHPVGGQVLPYQELAQRLGADIPVYAIQSPEVAGLPERYDTLDAMASAYAAVVEATQPDGPCHLAGWSTGGIIALAVAAKLAARGREVRYVGLIDSSPVLPADPVTEDRLVRHAAATVLAALRGRQFAPDEAAAMEASLAREGLDIAQLFDEAHRPFALSFLATWTGEPASADLLRFLQMQVGATANHLRLLAGYLPDATQARVHAIRPALQADRHRFDFLPERTDTLDGDHHSILKAPHVDDLARLMRAAMLAAAPRGRHTESADAQAECADALAS